MSLWWIFGFYFGERLLELLLARRNRRRLVARGGREFHPESYRTIVLLHTLFFASLLAESFPWRVPLDSLTLLCLIFLVFLQGLRYWCIVSLGEFWNTRIILIPGAEARRRGPYRFLRHPNYLAVTLEFAVIPLLMRAPLTLVVFSLANLVVLRQRIRLEEEALREFTDYGERFSRPPIND
jgi:methyltransferase